MVTFAVVMVTFGIFYLLPFQITSCPEVQISQGRIDEKAQDCAIKKKVAFIKVHKTGSTTITSILQRFGYAHNLTFALPTKDVYHVDLFGTFHPKKVLPVRKGSEYDILCQHVVYNREAFRKYLPHDVSVIAAVREPLERFVSTILFFNDYIKLIKSQSKKSLSTVDMLREFVKDPDRYEPKDWKNGSIAVNRMSFDFGIPRSKFFDYQFVEDYINMLDKNIDFVLVNEYFDASLVILKRKLCWSTKDILYEWRHRGKITKPTVPTDLRKKIEVMLQPDYQIYEFFKNKFHRIASQETGLFEEIRLFKETLQNVTVYCRKPVVHFIQVPATTFSPGFNFSRADCYQMSFSEAKFVKFLTKLQNSTTH